MAANDAWDLQGMNGGVPVEAGETFTGLSRGFQVLDDAIVAYSMVKPDGLTQAVAPIGTHAIGVYIGGPIVSLAVTSGTVSVFPTSTDYTIA